MRYGDIRLEECPDLEGIETSSVGCEIILNITCLEECPDLEGIETTQVD